jgi:hypothetical protein
MYTLLENGLSYVSSIRTILFSTDM